MTCSAPTSLSADKAAARSTPGTRRKKRSTESGKVWRKPKLRIGYMPQKIQVDATLPLSVLRFLRLVPGVDRAAALSALQEVGAEQVIDSPIQTISGG